ATGLANWQPRQWNPIGQTQDIYRTNGNIGIGTGTPTAKLDLVGQIKISGGNPGVGKVLTSDVNGLASWVTPQASSSQWVTSGTNIYYNNGNVGIGTTAPVTKLHLGGDGSIFANGNVGSGFILGGGGEAGTMMLWYARKASFRSGIGRWSDSTIGKYSFATGFLTTANGERSVAMGDNTNANSHVSVALGRYNVGGGASDVWNSADPLLEVGIGVDSDNKANALTILKNGNVGIGTATPVYSLELTTDSAAKPNGGSWSSTSDSRLKKDVATYTGALEKLTQLRGVNFKWINPENHGDESDTQGGFIAQEVAKVFPEWVKEVNAKGSDATLVGSGEKVKSISLPFEFDAVVVEAIKEQQEMIKIQQEKIDELTKRLEVLESITK
ncbi:MAG: tail fiber domain-containing protein, partial [Patescibacteria group bacterium]